MEPTVKYNAVHSSIRFWCKIACRCSKFIFNNSETSALNSNWFQNNQIHGFLMKLKLNHFTIKDGNSRRKQKKKELWKRHMQINHINSGWFIIANGIRWSRLEFFFFFYSISHRFYTVLHPDADVKGKLTTKIEKKIKSGNA